MAGFFIETRSKKQLSGLGMQNYLYRSVPAFSENRKGGFIVVQGKAMGNQGFQVDKALG